MSHDDSANFQLVPDAGPASEQPLAAVGVGSGRLVRAWDRILWGVAFSSPGSKQPFLVGESWHSGWKPRHDDEPIRGLVFKTRRAAREWAKAQTLDSKRHSVGWKFWAVRVRDTLCPNVKDEPCPPKTEK